MKRRIFLFVLAAVLCLTASALAVELTFAQTCTQKLGQGAQLYVLNESGDGLQAAQNLPAGTYIRTNGMSMEGKTGITYGFEQYGYIDSDIPIVSCSVSISLPNGETAVVGEALARSKQALNLWLEMEFGITLNGSTYTDENGEEHEIGNEAAEGGIAEDEQEAREAKYQSAKAKAQSSNGGYTVTVYRDETGYETEVQVLSLGLARSKVLLNGEEQMVETWRLSWDTEAPEDQVLAIVSPSNASDVRLRATCSEKATVLDRIPTTRVVQVIKTDKKWTLVDTNDEDNPRGYISTSVLSFYPNVQQDYKPGMIAVGGSIKAKGDDNLVRIREKASRKGREVGKFNLGEPLSIFPGEEGSEWTEVDVGGYHAYIQSKFVTVTEE